MQLLPPEVRYLQSDFMERGRGTIICDLNSRPLPEFPCSDVNVMGGVLEYVFDLRCVVEHLAQYAKYFIVSYACVARGTHIFERHVRSMDIEEVVTAPRSPWQNPYAECLVGSIRRECLTRIAQMD